jgi:hypothetical protein
MTAAVGGGTCEFPGDQKSPGGGAYDLLTIHCHSVLGYLPFCMSAAMLSTTRGRSSR